MKAGSSDCSRLWEVDAYREGRLGTKDAQSFERHMRICNECDSCFRGDERLRRLAAELPEEGPSALALRRLRARVLRDVATGVGAEKPLTSRARWALGASALAVAALVAGGLGVRRMSHAAPPVQIESPSAPVDSSGAQAFAGTVLESVGAHWTQARQQGREQVSLDSGSLRIHVRHQQDGERFLVSLPDGELEVRGTTFQVTVADGSTTRVHVEDGVVALRLDARPEVRLGAGDTWAAPVAAPAPLSSVAALARPMRTSPARAVAAPVAAPVAVPGPVAPPSPAVVAPAASEDDAESVAYSAAVALLRDGRNADAVAAFQAFVAKHASAPQLEDASFLEAVALARMGRVDAAALAAEEHLARFPSSFHRREAEALIARAHGAAITTSDAGARP